MRKLLPLLILLVQVTAFAQIPKSGLVAYYPLNGNANDSSGNGYNATINGPTPVSGECGPGYYFHNNYINCGSPAGGLFDLTNDATVCFWFKLMGTPSTSNAGYYTLLGKDVSGGSVEKWFILVHNDSIGFHINGPTYGGGYWRYSNYFPFSLNTFYHVTITKSGNNYQFFINAAPSGTATFPVNIPSNNKGMQMGQNEAINTNVVMDEVLVYNTVLTQPEIDSVYNACNSAVKANFAASTTSVCSGNCITFTNTSTNATSYNWNFPGAIIAGSTSQTPGNICYNTPGQYDVQLIAGNGAAFDTLLMKNYITVNASPVAGIVSGNPVAICTGATAQLANSGSTGNIQWQSSADSSLYTDIYGANDSTYQTPALSQTTYYKVIAKNGLCSNDTSSVITITVSALAGAGIITTPRDTICQGTPATLTLVNSVGSPIQWQSSADTINFNNVGPDATTYHTNPLLQTTYYRAQVGNGSCTSTTSIFHLYVPPILTAAFTTTASGKTITFNSGTSIGNITTYYWDFGDGTTNNIANPVHTFGNDSLYNVCLTIYDGSNCSYTFCRNQLFTGIASINAMGNFEVYPNPFGGLISVAEKGSAKSITAIELYDVLGRMVQNRNTGSLHDNTYTINVSSLANGMYYLKIKTNKAYFVQKVVKQ